MMKNIEIQDMIIKGELAVRMSANYARLEGEWYRPDEVFSADEHDWPGDWEGRLILALSLLEQSTGRKSAYLEEIVEELPKHFNAHGHMGRILQDGYFAEQHMAGHSWLIRGLIEYYKITKDDGVKALVQQIVNNFLLPVKGSYKNYPLTMQEREENKTNWVLSQKQSKISTHSDTSDAGCAFIMIDGATEAYDFLKDERLYELIVEMIERYEQMDFLGCHIQTHATLSAARGVVRFYNITKSEKYLRLAERIFNLYKSEAWSEAYGNYNWFGIPHWTEPCAIIDSYMLAVQLWSLTKNTIYLTDAYKIFYNAVSHANRISGAFGTDNCVGAAEAEYLSMIKPKTYEVYWCCNMRGGEGLTRASQYSYWKENNTIYNVFFHNSDVKIELDSGSISLRTVTGYPYEGNVNITVKDSNITSNIKIMFFVPECFSKISSVKINTKEAKYEYKDGFIIISGVFLKGTEISLTFEQKLVCKKAVHKHTVEGYHKYFYGPLLLSYKKDNSEQEDISLDENITLTRQKFGRFMIDNTDICLSSLYETRDMIKEDSVRQVLFRGNI